MQKTDARNDILASIRRHLAASAPFDALHREHHAHKKKLIEPAPLVTAENLQNVSLIERFRENLISIGGNCEIADNVGEASQLVQAIIEKSNAQHITVSDSEIVKQITSELNAANTLIENASAKMLFESDLGITSAQFGIAETGTLVLESDHEFHRLTSLVPPIHVCLLEAKNLRQTLGETLRILERDLSRTITFITGPSRTSDIELTLAIGVHGPAELHVIILNR